MKVHMMFEFAQCVGVAWYSFLGHNVHQLCPALIFFWCIDCGALIKTGKKLIFLLFLNVQQF